MNADRLLACYDRIADAPEAIPRLRRYILDLAVRGKLVPQDPNDEPASELLKRIAAEKARLVKAGEIRSEKPSETAGPDALPFDLRDGWQAVSMKQVLLELQTGPFGSSLHQSDYEVGGTPVVNPASIQNERIIPIEKMAVDGATLDRLSTFKLRTGDIVMGRRGEMGRCAVVTDREEGWLCGTGSLILRLPQSIYARFLVLLIGSPYVRWYLVGSAVGATMQNLNQSILLNLVIGLPALAEQHRIVAKVDELMTLCDQLEAARAAREAIRDRLTSASLARLNEPDPDPATFTADAGFALNNLAALTSRHDQIKPLRQTILNLAVRGKLVPQDPNDEPAYELLKRIAAEKTRLVSSGEIREPKQVSAVQQQSLPFDAPPGWVWSSLAEISRKIHYGFTASASQAIKDIRLLRITDIQENKVDWCSVPGCEIDENTIPQFKLEKADILIARTGGTIGKSFLVEDIPVAAVFASYLIRVQGSREIYERYLKLFLDSPPYWAQLKGGARGAGQPNVNGKTLGNMLFPLAPLAEQQRIVAKVNELMELCERLEANLSAANENRRRLLEAILHEALAPAVAMDDAA